MDALNLEQWSALCLSLTQEQWQQQYNHLYKLYERGNYAGAVHLNIEPPTIEARERLILRRYRIEHCELLCSHLSRRQFQRAVLSKRSALEWAINEPSHSSLLVGGNSLLYYRVSYVFQSTKQAIPKHSITV